MSLYKIQQLELAREGHVYVVVETKTADAVAVFGCFEDAEEEVDRRVAERLDFPGERETFDEACRLMAEAIRLSQKHASTICGAYTATRFSILSRLNHVNVTKGDDESEPHAFFSSGAASSMTLSEHGDPCLVNVKAWEVRLG